MTPVDTTALLLGSYFLSIAIILLTYPFLAYFTYKETGEFSMNVRDVVIGGLMVITPVINTFLALLLIGFLSIDVFKAAFWDKPIFHITNKEK